jgi:polysaccharide deacetylase family protein (PEP-CTERM system associated)
MKREPLSLTIDLESHGSRDQSLRFLEAMEPLLEFLDKLNISSTFFVVGETSHKCEEMIRTLHRAGHEIALHGNTHTYLNEFTPNEFRIDIQRGRDKLESIIQSEVVGYRAPFFSLTKKTLWAPKILTEENFIYSSSILPAYNPQASFPFAPRSPFTWSSGLIEFPVPTFGLGQFRAPVLGGAYLRLSPLILVKLAKFMSRNSVGTWTYCHPYDFDVEEDFRLWDGEGWVISRLLFARRRLMLDRIRRVVSPGSSSLVRIASNEIFRNALPIWNP